MNRFSRISLVAALAAFALAATSAEAKVKEAKKKKNEDLSANPLVNLNSKQPDKVLFDKAMDSMKHGRYDVARLTLQTLLNTYPDSEYRMRAKLAVGDTWFKEGGTAALTQAEAEYKDFETFFPNAPEAAEAQMKVGDIYYQQMEKPDRDFTNAQRAEEEYRVMINQYPDSALVPRARQRLRDVQEVLAEREAEVGFFYESRENFSAAIARLDTVADTFPLYSRSDEVLIGIGDSYAGQAKRLDTIPGMSGAVKERLRGLYLDRAAAAYTKAILRYPMAMHVEDARDRLVAMNRPIPEPSQKAIADNDAEERSRQQIHFVDHTLGIIKRGPTVVAAAHVGDPTLDDPKRTVAPDVNRESLNLYTEAANPGKSPTEAKEVVPTGPNEPPRSDVPSTAPVESGAPGAGNSVGVSIVSAPSGGDPNALVQPVTSATAAVPAAEGPAEAPIQVNDIKPGSAPPPAAVAADSGKKTKAPKTDLNDESSTKKKKKKGLGKLNPF